MTLHHYAPGDIHAHGDWMHLVLAARSGAPLRRLPAPDGLPTPGVYRIRCHRTGTRALVWEWDAGRRQRTIGAWR